MEFKGIEKDFNKLTSPTDLDVIEKHIVEQVQPPIEEDEKHKDVNVYAEKAIITNEVLTQEAKNILEADSAQLKVGTCVSTIALCTLPTLKGFKFCQKHILEDKTSPYKRCNFISKEDNKRCNYPAPKLGN